MLSTWCDLHAPSVEEMGDEWYRRNFAMGMQMSDGEILLEAMAIASPPGYTRQTSLPLSRREVEILELLSDWLTNQEIADRLFISKRTVDRHVSSILSKLGVGTRREAVAVARRHHTHAAT
ncbi:MAG: LuxR C-terminal-related transcriptional regulator, partial [Thermomicrobiales bacterium]